MFSLSICLMQLRSYVAIVHIILAIFGNKNSCIAKLRNSDLEMEHNRTKH
jgi:hypothetical protein